MSIEEAKEILNKGIATGNFVTIDYVETEIAVKTVLKALDDSVSKAVIKEIIDKLEDRIKEYRKISINNTDREEVRLLNDSINELKTTIQILQKLLK